jgi:hypothetical protein
MATISIDNWLDEVVPAAQLCPTVIIRKDILNACRDFCRGTELWRQTLAAISIVADQAEYPLTISGSDIVSGERVTIDGNADQLAPVSEQSLDYDTRETEDWRTKTGAISECKRYFVDENYACRLVYIPDAALADGLHIAVNVMPLETATVVPLFLYNEYKETIANGAKAKLKLRLDMPWTDIKLGAAFGGMFEDGIFKGKQKKFTGFQHSRTRDIVRTHYHDF